MEDKKDNKEFDYDAAVRRIGEIVAAVESPDVPVTRLGPLVREARGLVARCRAFLRGLQEEIGKEEEDEGQDRQ